MICSLACTDLSHVLKFSMSKLFETIVAPANRQIVMCESETIIDATIHVFYGIVLEYLLHVDILSLCIMVPFA